MDTERKEETCKRNQEKTTKLVEKLRPQSFRKEVGRKYQERVMGTQV